MTTLNLNPEQRAIFIAKHMNVFLDEERGDRILMLNLQHRFLNIYPFYEDIYNYGVKEFDTEVIYFMGPQNSSVIDCVVQLVMKNSIRTEEHEEDMNAIIRDEVNDYYQKLVHQGRIEGQMAISRLPNLVMPKDIRQKIGKMTK